MITFAYVSVILLMFCIVVVTPIYLFWQFRQDDKELKERGLIE